MSSKPGKPSVLLLGDGAIDWFRLSKPGARARGEVADQNWRNHRQWEFWRKPGGVALVDRMFRQLGIPVETAATAASDEGFIRSLAWISPLNDSETDREDRFRVSRFEGYGPPSDDSTSLGVPDSVKPDEHAIVVLDDPGNGFRDRPEKWLAHLKHPGISLVIHKMSMPLAQGALWDHIADLEGVARIAVLNAEDLRNQGFDLSRRLSWDRTMEDVGRALADADGDARNELIGRLTVYERVVICFDCDAAAVITKSDTGELSCDLVYDPEVAEGDFDARTPGYLPGKMSSVVSFFLKHLLRRGVETGGPDRKTMLDAVKAGLSGARAFSADAFSLKAGNLEYPKVKTGHASNHKFQTFRMRRKTQPISLARSANSANMRKIAEDVLCFGHDKLGAIPSAQFGHFMTVDRNEIEGYRSIADLIKRHREDPNVTKPLSIAVFGPPGAGKSFGVKQIAGENPPPFEFNVAEFGDGDLAGALHELRDKVLEGHKPLCFFDEFDSHDLAYLARFLAPMQDGQFRHGPRTHPIGPAILVFAGGTKSTFWDFAEQVTVAEQRNDLDGAKRLRGRKVPDFVSRLAGFINVRGPNRTETEAKDSEDYILRRAILLRSMLHDKAPSLFSPDGKLSIDRPVANAFLGVDSFNHGSRSIEMLLRMSQLTQESERLTVSDLPYRDQLALHVDPEQFENLLKG